MACSKWLTILTLVISIFSLGLALASSASARRPGLSGSTVHAGWLGTPCFSTAGEYEGQVCVASLMTRKACINKTDGESGEEIRHTTFRWNGKAWIPEEVSIACASKSSKGRWNFTARMTPKYQRLFLASVDRGNSGAKRMVRQAINDNRVYVSLHKRLKVSFGGITILDFSQREMLFAPIPRSHHVWHEIGHMVDQDMIYLHSKYTHYKPFKQLWRKSPNWRNCFPLNLPQYYPGRRCVPMAEVFAEQFSHWAIGQSSYRGYSSVPQLSSRAAFGKLMEQVLVDHRRWLQDHPGGVLCFPGCDPELDGP